MTGRRWLHRLQAHIAAAVLGPKRTTRAVVLCILVYAALGIPILIGLKAAQDLFMDAAEAYVWGQRFLGGYGKHPPLTGWIAAVWYSVFPAEDWASYTLSHVMVGISLVCIYFIGRRVLDNRRSVLLVFAMMLYPLFHYGSNRFNNYQVLIAVVPLLVLTFLIAFERRTAFWGCLLGVSAAAASLTMYSGLIALAAVGLAAVLDSDRHAFFRSPAPYCAAAVYLVALMPHGLWLVERDFPSLKWATGQMGGQSVVRQAAVYFLENAGRMALPIAGAAVALWPWRARPAAERAVAGRDARMVLIIAVVLVVLPLVLAFGLSIDLKGDWGFAFFLFVPTALLILFPRLLVTRRAVTAIVTLAAIGMAGLLAAAPVVPLVNFWLKPGFGGHEPISELAAEVTRLWRERYGTPLPVVVSYFDIAAPIVFYSPDHPLMYADFLPAFSPWFDYPEGLRKGFVAVCRADNTACIANANALDPDAERIELALSRTFAGMARQPARFQVRIAGAKS